jgi:hypothetical protein
MNLKKMLTTAVLMVAVCSISALAQAPAEPEFQLCKGIFALCTFSQCEPIMILETPLLFSCGCRVHRDEWSVGTQSCAGVEEVPGKGQLIRSRYYPDFTTYARCSNNRPWAMCLDSPCIIDKNDPTKAQCTCSVVQGQGDYLVQPGTEQCSKGAISSATVVDLDQITDFLETQPNLPPPNISVVNVKPK